MSDDDTYNVIVQRDDGNVASVEDVPESMLGYVTDSLQDTVGNRSDYEVYVETVKDEKSENA